jgi:hypothetical protein
MIELEASSWIEGWFVVEGAPFGQPEGTKEEWTEILKAMREKRPHRFKRCGVKFTQDYAYLYSPRNRYSEADCVALSPTEQEHFIKQAETLLGLDSNDYTI